MDQPKSDKFSELSPVLELVYVMLTNMGKYMDVYATDIEAEKTEQYLQAKEAVDAAIRKFDTLYGLKSPASSVGVDATEVGSFDDEGNDDLVDDVVASPAPVAPISNEQSSEEAPASPKEKPYEYASGNDPESLKKAKQAVEELKTLFADMKKQESTVPQPVADTQSAPATTPAPVSAPAPTPTFVSPVASAPVASAPVASVPVAPTVVSAQTPVVTPEVPPTVAAPATPASDPNEIDSILAELKNLQNKGNTQL